MVSKIVLLVLSFSVISTQLLALSCETSCALKSEVKSSKKAHDCCQSKEEKKPCNGSFYELCFHDGYTYNYQEKEFKKSDFDCEDIQKQYRIKISYNSKKESINRYPDERPLHLLSVKTFILKNQFLI